MSGADDPDRNYPDTDRRCPPEGAERTGKIMIDSNVETPQECYERTGRPRFDTTTDTTRCRRTRLRCPISKRRVTRTYFSAF